MHEWAEFLCCTVVFFLVVLALNISSVYSWPPLKSSWSSLSQTMSLLSLCLFLIMQASSFCGHLFWFLLIHKCHVISPSLWRTDFQCDILKSNPYCCTWPCLFCLMPAARRLPLSKKHNRVYPLLWLLHSRCSWPAAVSRLGEHWVHDPLNHRFLQSMCVGVSFHESAQRVLSLIWTEVRDSQKFTWVKIYVWDRVTAWAGRVTGGRRWSSLQPGTHHDLTEGMVWCQDARPHPPGSACWLQQVSLSLVDPLPSSRGNPGSQYLLYSSVYSPSRNPWERKFLYSLENNKYCTLLELFLGFRWFV